MKKSILFAKKPKVEPIPHKIYSLAFMFLKCYNIRTGQSQINKKTAAEPAHPNTKHPLKMPSIFEATPAKSKSDATNNLIPATHAMAQQTLLFP